MAIHDCPNCGQTCYCDGDDSNDARRSEDDCRHECQEDGEVDDFYPGEELEVMGGGSD